MTNAIPRALKILLVEDDDFLRPTLESCLKSAGHEVVCAPGGQEAQSLLSLNDFDVVVSDINMPGVNGIQLLNWMKIHRPFPVILMTGFADLAETLEAHSSGAAGFLAKPFKKEDLFKAVNDCFPTSEIEDQPIEDVEDNYCRLSLADFVSGSDIKFDIFVRLSYAKYVKIAHSGQDITVERIKAYREKGVTHLYLTKIDFRGYVNFNTRLARIAAGSTKINREKKINLIKHTGEIISANLYGEFLDADSVADAKSMIETTIQVLSDNNDAFALLELMKSHTDHLYAHGTTVAFYAVLVARRMGWRSPATLFKVSLGGLFHDIGFKEMERELLDRARKDLASAEISLLETHTGRGAKLLSELEDIPSDVVQIALEHHENCVGSGYPRRARKTQIHPLAKLISAVNEFCEQVVDSPNGKAKDPHEVIKRIVMLNVEHFDPEVFQGLMQLFRFPVPRDFVENIKKRQRLA